MTYRANNWVRTILVESLWQAISKEKAMLKYYLHHGGKINGKKSIIKVAKKLFKILTYTR